MNRLRPLLILLAGLALAGGLTALILHERKARDEGREVALRMQGFDPRDLLSGHYVAFTLVEPLRPAEMCPVTLIPRRPVTGLADDRGWVALSPREDHWQATGAADSQAAAARLGVLTVRGSAVCEPDEPHQITLNIGLTRLHASQEQAQWLSRAIMPGGDGAPPAYAIVSIGRDGKARLKGVRLGAERIGLDW